jgi:hypothetical protein
MGHGIEDEKRVVLHRNTASFEDDEPVPHIRRDARASFTTGCYARSKPTGYPKLGAFVGVIRRIPREDESAPRKQRHTALRMDQRLKSEQGYESSIDPVRRHVASLRQSTRETFMRLDPVPHAGIRLTPDNHGHPRPHFKIAVIIGPAPIEPPTLLVLTGRAPHANPPCIPAVDAKISAQKSFFRVFSANNSALKRVFRVFSAANSAQKSFFRVFSATNSAQKSFFRVFSANNSELKRVFRVFIAANSELK